MSYMYNLYTPGAFRMMPRTAGSKPDLYVPGCSPKPDSVVPEVKHLYKLVALYKQVAPGQVEQKGHVCCPLDNGYPWKALLDNSYASDTWIASNYPWKAATCVSVDNKAIGRPIAAQRELAETFAANDGLHSSYQIHVGGGNTSILDPMPSATSQSDAGAYLWGKAPYKEAVHPNSEYPSSYGYLVNPRDPLTGRVISPQSAPNTLTGNLKKIFFENKAASTALIARFAQMERGDPDREEIKAPMVTANFGNLTRGIGSDSDVRAAYENGSRELDADTNAVPYTYAYAADELQLLDGGEAPPALDEGQGDAADGADWAAGDEAAAGLALVAAAGEHGLL